MPMNESGDDLKLRKLLRKSRGVESLPPRFQERVWQRIESAESTAVRTFSLTEWLGALFARPAVAPLFVAVLVVIGVSTGYLLGGHKAARWDAQLSSGYIASITAYADGKP